MLPQLSSLKVAYIFCVLLWPACEMPYTYLILITMHTFQCSLINYCSYVTKLHAVALRAAVMSKLCSFHLPRSFITTTRHLTPYPGARYILYLTSFHLSLGLATVLFPPPSFCKSVMHLTHHKLPHNLMLLVLHTVL